MIVPGTDIVRAVHSLAKRVRAQISKFLSKHPLHIRDHPNCVCRPCPSAEAPRTSQVASDCVHRALALLKQSSLFEGSKNSSVCSSTCFEFYMGFYMKIKRINYTRSSLFVITEQSSCITWDERHTTMVSCKGKTHSDITGCHHYGLTWSRLSPKRPSRPKRVLTENSTKHNSTR